MFTRYKVMISMQNDNIIEYLERLALLKFSDEEKEKLKKEVEKIIELFNALLKVEGLDNVEPLYHVIELELPLRDDEPLHHLDIEHEMLKDNAILENGYVKAPKTVG